ncbi:putative replication initiation protein [uncultured Microviridae]|nr:putative replication initiation protein [uncultured Microviridae]
MEVACSQCIGCRLDHAGMWASRIEHESSLYDDSNGNCFITLTYDEEHLPQDWSLDKSHFQKFMKRLRKRYPQKIRYYHCGEYGENCRHGIHTTLCPGCNVGRPHYHAILFNIDFHDRVLVGQSKGIPHFTSDTLTEIWGHGFTQVGDLTAQSAGYVARYALKKVTGTQAEDHYRSIDLTTGEVTYVRPEYATMSRKPGIGKEWYEKYKKDMYPSNQTPSVGGGVKNGIPRFYDKLMEKEDPEQLEIVKEKRKEFALDNMHDNTGPRLLDKATVKLAAIKTLKRDL